MGYFVKKDGISRRESEKQGVIKNGFMLFDVTGDMEITVEFSAGIVQKENCGGVYFERGPLVYSLGMAGKREKTGDADFPAYRMYADEKWNYAVVGGGEPQFAAGTGTKWDLREDLPAITVTCREVKSWHLRRAKKLRGINWKYETITKTFEKPAVLTPRLPAGSRMRLAEETKRITLRPYGACKLRMTVLPKTDK